MVERARCSRLRTAVTDRPRRSATSPGLNAPTSTNSPAQPGSRNGFLITKPLTIKGAGANKVFIEAAGAAGSSLAGTAPYLRDGGGAVIQINRQSLGSSDMTENFVDISGVTVRSPDVYAEAGIAFFNTSGRISNSVVGPLYHADIPRSELVWMDDASHFLQVDAPERTVAQIMSFDADAGSAP